MPVAVINSDLQRERENATIVVERLTHMLDGGGDNGSATAAAASTTARRRHLEAIVERDPTGVFDNTDNMYMSRQERHVRALAKHVRLIELCRMLKIGDKFDGDILADPDFALLVAAVADDLPTALHWIMFVPNIRTLCDAEQHAAWLPLCRDWHMIGCYAQTELGHGSNVRALETTATFVPASMSSSNDKNDPFKDGSFVIHSPTQTATKFWPGTLGRTANHAMVIARLIDGQGIDRGMHNFLVPLRDMKTHKLLPGVVTGDIGPKIGYNSMDNGFAMFDNVRIPRRNMAMRFATINEQGVYAKRQNASSNAASKIAYITMMQVRAHICNEAGKNLAMACTIVIRYSAVRRQGFATEDAKELVAKPAELQILDYKQQQHRIFPLLASSYCFFFTGKKVLQKLRELEHKLVHHEPLTKAQVTDVHASSSALKSFTTTVTADGIEDCRKACGGHGYLACSGLPELYLTYLQNPTVEGDNHMLPQQVVKVLLKLVEAVQSSKTATADDDLRDYEPCDSYHLVPSLQAILSLPSQKQSSSTPPSTSQTSLRCEAQCANDIQSIPLLLQAFCHRAARILVGVAQQLQHSQRYESQTPQQAWNNALVEMARASRAYSQFLLLHNFVSGIDTEYSSDVIGETEADVLRDLARLFALYWMEREMGDFMEDGYLSAAQSRWVRQGVLQLLSVIRPNAVALVDARDFSDFRLKSALGRYDGNVYPAIMKAAWKEGLNQTDPGPGYQEHLKRLIVDGVGKYQKAGTASRL